MSRQPETHRRLMRRSEHINHERNTLVDRWGNERRLVAVTFGADGTVVEYVVEERRVTSRTQEAAA